MMAEATCVSVVLLPNDADNRALVRLSQAVNSARPSRITLGTAALPHITVAQFEAPAPAAAELWQQTRQLAGGFSLRSGGLNFVPGSDELWVELQFLKSAEIVQLQAEILKTDFAGNYRLHNHPGDVYRPHCTLALYDELTVPELELAGYDVFQREFTDMQFAVGLNGENFTFIDPKYR